MQLFTCKICPCHGTFALIISAQWYATLPSNFDVFLNVLICSFGFHHFIFCRGTNGIFSFSYAWELWHHSLVLLLQFNVSGLLKVTSSLLCSTVFFSLICFTFFFLFIYFPFYHYRDLDSCGVLAYRRKMDSLRGGSTSWGSYIFGFGHDYFHCCHNLNHSTSIAGDSPKNHDSELDFRFLSTMSLFLPFWSNESKLVALMNILCR